MSLAKDRQSVQDLSQQSFMKIIKNICGLLCLLSLCGGMTQSLRADELAGLAVGERAPKFALKNQDGKPVSSEELLKKGPVVVVFYRSADW